MNQPHRRHEWLNSKARTLIDMVAAGLWLLAHDSLGGRSSGSQVTHAGDQSVRLSQPLRTAISHRLTTRV